MLEQHDLKIIDIDTDGHAIASFKKNKQIIKINFDKKNIVFNKGDFVSAIIKKNKKKIINVKIIKKLNIFLSFYGTIIKNDNKYLTIRKLSKKDDLYITPVSTIKKSFLKLIKKGMVVKAKEIKNNHFNFKRN